MADCSAIQTPQSDRKRTDFITVDEAATLTEQSVRHWRRIATRQAATESPQPLAFRGAPRVGKGKPVWYVHRSLDKRLGRFLDGSTVDDRVRSSLMERYPQAHVELAYRKAHWLAAWRDRCRRPRVAGVTDADIARQVAEQARRTEEPGFKISLRSLQLWQRAHRDVGPDGRPRGVEALVPQYTAARGDEAASLTRSPEAVEHFYSLFHAPNRLSRQMCHDATLREAGRCGWTWPTAYNATTRWLRQHDKLDVTCLKREGARAYSHTYMSHLQTDWDAIQPGEMYVCDHTQCDFWVVYRDKQIRPWLTAVQDMRSRMIAGWHFGAAPHSDAIAASFRMAFADRAIPEKMRIDNGKDYCSKFLTGLTKREMRLLRKEFGGRWKDVIRCKRDAAIDQDPRWLGLTPELGIELIYAIPYAAWAKGTIERWFGRFEDQCGKTFITYCGNSPATRPDCLEQIRSGRIATDRSGLAVVDGSQVPTLDQARTRIGEYIELYHKSEHRGDGMNGRTPLQVWATATRLRRAEPEALAFLTTIRGAYRVGGNGVTVTVGSARISYGARSPALKRLAGRKVLISVDPNCIAQAFAFDVDSRRLLGRLDANERIHPCATTEDVREAIATEQRGRKVMRSAQRTAARRNRTATQRISANATERLGELRATGTDDAAATPNVVPVRTGFEGSSKPARTAASAPTIDRKARDLTAAKAALGHGVGLSQKRRGRRRVSDDLLRGWKTNDSQTLKDEGADDEGKDAGTTPTDAFGLIARSDRYEQRTDE